jgi:hypothetical protein
MVAGGSGGATIGKTIFTYVYIEKKSSSPEPIKLGINHTWVKGILNYSNKGPGPLQRGDNLKTAKMGWGHLKPLFSRTTEPE